MVADGFTITRAIQSRSWPAASANLEYAAVWGTMSRVPDDLTRVADDTSVRRISTLLEPTGRVSGMPARLAENAELTFNGVYPLGQGFLVDEETARSWIAADPRNREVLAPYLNGEDLNSSPDFAASRWAVDFNNRSEDAAAAYVLPFQQLLTHVKPERTRLKPDGSFALRRPLPDRWWQYADKRPGLRRALDGMDEALVITVVSKTVMPVRVSARQILSNMLCVFALDGYGDQAILSSSLHQLWAITYGSTLETRVRYTPSDVFDTFPRPASTERLEKVGRSLDSSRQEMMKRRELGLTKLYNLVNDSRVRGDTDVDRLRELHVEVDAATVAAYGWDDVPLGHGFHSYRQAERWSLSSFARVELLDRLLAENHTRKRRDRLSAVGQELVTPARVAVSDRALFD